MVIETFEERPVAASALRTVAMAGNEAGAKTTVPSMAEMAVADWVSNSGPGEQTVWGAQGAVHAWRD